MSCPVSIFHSRLNQPNSNRTQSQLYVIHVTSSFVYKQFKRVLIVPLEHSTRIEIEATHSPHILINAFSMPNIGMVHTIE